MEPMFSCCHMYRECDYGRKECFFSETKPDMKERCRCYELKRAKKIEVGIAMNTHCNELEQLQEKEDKVSSINQLSLF